MEYTGGFWSDTGKFLGETATTPFIQIGKNLNSTFNFGNFNDDLKWNSLKDRVDNWEDWTINWTAFEKNTADAEQNIKELKQELSSLQDDALSVQNSYLDPIENATKGVKSTLSNVVKILDILAGNNTDATASEKLLSSVINVCNALTACIAPVTEIGFPEIPILGNIGDFLKMIMQKDRIYQMLPEEIRKQVNENMKQIKAPDKNADQVTKTLWERFKDTEWADLLYSGWIDILKIMGNLPFLPITILCAAVSVLIDAVSQLFNVVGLGTFNFDSLIKGKTLNFNMNIQDPGFSFDPPGNILEALVKCIPLITNAIVTLPQMLINGVIENLYLICGGIKSIAATSIWQNHDREFMISAINDTILSNELFIENNKLSSFIKSNNDKLNDIKRQMEIENFKERSQGYDVNEGGSIAVTAKGRIKAEEQLNEGNEFGGENLEEYNNDERVKTLTKQNEEYQNQIESNLARMKTLVRYEPQNKETSK